jgi:hypothetical protein
VDPPRGPKEKILTFKFTMKIPPEKVFKKILKNRRKPHNTWVIPKKQTFG